MPAKRYELSKCSVTADGYALSGYGEGGVEIQFMETVSSETGPDGETAVSYQTPHKATMKITLMPSAAANKHLFSIWQAQLAEDVLTERAFTLRDPANGDEVNAKAFVIAKTPDMVKAAKAGLRVWECEIYSFTRRFAADIAG